MALSGASGSGRVLSLNTLVRLRRAPRTPGASRRRDEGDALGGPASAHAPRRLPLPEGMTVPLGFDAVAAPARLGPLVMPRLPRVGCVYADETHWWWIVPSDSDYALRWPSPAHYATGAVLTGMPDSAPPALLHRPDGTIPYTPPIPLYLVLCRVTGTTPAWSPTVRA
ncbi:hypothetical protein [Streptomyces sp. NPDC046985]|uniref:hypothetical protein n=1 Tax=Streptomyces sp. NPDC046985 TaxID=3155377 RepID=UPI0033C3FBC1